MNKSFSLSILAFSVLFLSLSVNAKSTPVIKVNNSKNEARIIKTQTVIGIWPSLKVQMCTTINSHPQSIKYCLENPNKFDPARHSICLAHTASSISYLICSRREHLSVEKIRECFFTTDSALLEALCLLDDPNLKNETDLIGAIEEQYGYDVRDQARKPRPAENPPKEYEL